MYVLYIYFKSSALDLRKNGDKSILTKKQIITLHFVLS